MSFRRLPWSLCVGAMALMITGAAMADGATSRYLREYGFAGSYTGIVRGHLFSRTSASASFTTVPVSKLVKEQMPQPDRQSIESPFGSGAEYLVFVKTSVNRRRAVIRALYYGETFNPALGATTVRTGAKVLTVNRNARRGEISRMSLTDNMKEYNTTGDLLAEWKLKGSLEK